MLKIKKKCLISYKKQIKPEKNVELDLKNCYSRNWQNFQSKKVRREIKESDYL